MEKIMAKIVIGAAVGVGMLLIYQNYLIPKKESTPISQTENSTDTSQTNIAVERDEKRMEDLEKIRDYLNLYYLNISKGKFPQDLNQLLEINQKFPDLIKVIPKDPKTNELYKYTNLADGQDFQLCAHLEEIKEEKCLSSNLGSETQKQELLQEAEKYTEKDGIRERDAQRIIDLNLLRTALEMYYSDFNSYPKNLSVLNPKYIKAIPLDPLTNKPYFYYAACPDGRYHLGTELEDENNSNLKQDRDVEKCDSADFSGKDPIYDLK